MQEHTSTTGEIRAAERQTDLVRIFALVTAITSLVASGVVLAGWLAGERDWQRLFLWQITIKANTAIGIALLAGALLRKMSLRHSPGWRRLADAAAGLAALLGAVTLAQYALGRDLGVDQLIVSAAADAGSTATPGRMAAVTALLLTLIGMGFVLDQVRDDARQRVAQALLLTSVAISMTMLLSYAHGAIPTVGAGHGLQIAPVTATLLLALALSGLVLRRHLGWMAPVFSRGFGGLTARRLLPFAFLVPLVMMVVRALGPATGIETYETVSAATAVMTMLAFAGVIWINVSALETADEERTRAVNERLRLTSEAAAERARRVAAEEAKVEVEAAMREKAEAQYLLDVLLNSAPVGYAVFDTHLRFVRVNPAFAAMGLLSPDEHTGKGLREIFGRDTPVTDAGLQHVLATGEAVLDKEISATTDGGNDRYWLASAYPLRRSNGETFAIGAIVMETTDRKQLQSQLLQAQKMEVVGQLAGGIAHDFNNLLTVIRSYSSFLEEELEKGSEHHGFAAEIGSAADRAAALTRQLLSFSRKHVIQARPVRIDEVTDGIQRIVGRLLPSNVQLTLTLGAPDAVVVIDPGQWEQVVMNMAINAGHAMPAGGKIAITSEQVHVDERAVRTTPQLRVGQYVLIQIADTGEGMSEETQARIFEPFFTTKELGKGTGLGLSMAYGVVHEHGGAITVHSAVGRGTVFRIYLPITEEDSPDHVVESRPAMGKGEIIMVVDDDAAVRSAVRESLERYGYTVLDARDGAHALAVAKLLDTPPNLVLTDLMMPGISGRELVERLDGRGHVPKVLLMSGYTDDEIMRRDLADSRYPFIQKPFTRDELARKVREVLDGN